MKIRYINENTLSVFSFFKTTQSPGQKWDGADIHILKAYSQTELGNLCETTKKTGLIIQADQHLASISKNLTRQTINRLIIKKV